MSTQIVKHEDTSLAETMTLGDVFRQSGYFNDVRDKAQAVVKILMGRELGFSPVVSMTGIHIIQGKPALSSNLMAAMIKRSGKYDYRVTSWSNTECVITFREKMGSSWQDVGLASFSIDDAKRAKIKVDGGSNWEKFPKAMLFARALSQGMRAYCPDVSISPIYVPEELGAEVNEEGDVITVESEPVPEKKLSFKKKSGIEVHNMKCTKDNNCPVHYGECKTSVTLNPEQARPRAEVAEPAAVERVSPAAAVSFESEQYPGREIIVDQLQKSIDAIHNAEPEPTYINLSQQAELLAKVRVASPNLTSARRRDHLHVWLADNEYFDDDGNSTLSKIKVQDLEHVTHMLTKWIAVQ